MSESSMSIEVKSTDKTIGRTKKEIKKSERGLKKKSWVKSTAGRIGLSVAALGILTGGVYEAYQHDTIPGVHRTIDVPAIFNNDKDSGVIGNNNTIGIDGTMLANIDIVPTPTLRHDINLLTPFKALPPSVNINYEKSFTGIAYDKEETDNAKENNIKDTITFKDIPKDAIIVAPVDGLLEFYSVPRVAREGSIQAINFFYKSADGKIYQISMGGSVANLFKSLIDVKPFTFEKGTDESALRVEVKRGQEVAMLLQTADLSLTTKTWVSGQFAGKISPDNINLITIPNNVGQDKLAILEK